jgi:hypothetical protein
MLDKKNCSAMCFNSVCIEAPEGLQGGTVEDICQRNVRLTVRNLYSAASSFVRPETASAFLLTLSMICLTYLSTQGVHLRSCGRIASPGREWNIEDQAILLRSSTDLASDYGVVCGTLGSEVCVQQDRKN